MAIPMRQMPGWGVRLVSRIAAPVKRADRPYTSPEWRALMKRVKAMRGAFCGVCGAGGNGVRIIGDHRVEVKDGGAMFDEANIDLLCTACHNAKTARARAKRVGRG